MSRKNIFLNILFIFFLSLFNTLYKYIIVTENISSLNSSFGSAFMTTSNIKPPYQKIFLFSLITLLIIEIILVFILYFANKKEIDKSILFNKLSNFLPIIVSLICGLGLVFVNKVVSFIVLFIGLIIYLYFVYKNFNKKSFIIILVFIIAQIFILHYISI